MFAVNRFPRIAFALPVNAIPTIISQIVLGANSSGPSTPVYINISTNGPGADQALSVWKGDVVTKLQAVANLPASGLTTNAAALNGQRPGSGRPDPLGWQ